MSSIHVGKRINQTVTASDGSAIALGALTATAGTPSVISASVDPATNKVTLLGVGTGSSIVTYAAPGFTSKVISHSVLAAVAPSLVVTDDGPEF